MSENFECFFFGRMSCQRYLIIFYELYFPLKYLNRRKIIKYLKWVKLVTDMYDDDEARVCCYSSVIANIGASFQVASRSWLPDQAPHLTFKLELTSKEAKGLEWVTCMPQSCFNWNLSPLHPWKRIAAVTDWSAWRSSLRTIMRLQTLHKTCIKYWASRMDNHVFMFAFTWSLSGRELSLEFLLWELLEVAS